MKKINFTSLNSFMAASLAAVLSSGCVHTQPPKASQQDVDFVGSMMTKYAEEANRSLNALAAAGKPNVSERAPQYVPPPKEEKKPGLDLTQKISVSVSRADIEEVISRLCKDTGWTKLPSDRRVNAVLVTVKAEKMAMIDVLKAIGAAAGSGADLVISKENKTIKINYKAL